MNNHIAAKNKYYKDNFTSLQQPTGYLDVDGNTASKSTSTILIFKATATATTATTNSFGRGNSDSISKWNNNNKPLILHLRK